MKRLVLILALLLSACGPNVYGLVFDSTEDPKVLAQETANVLDEWDTLVGVRHPTPIYILGADNDIWSPRELGLCERAGGQTRVSINIEAIKRYKLADRIFRHVLFHELYHAEASCSDTDHSSDPKDLMFPLVTRENLEALPTAKQRALIGAP